MGKPVKYICAVGLGSVIASLISSLSIPYFTSLFGTFDGDKFIALNLVVIFTFVGSFIGYYFASKARRNELNGTKIAIHCYGLYSIFMISLLVFVFFVIVMVIYILIAIPSIALF